MFGKTVAAFCYHTPVRSALIIRENLRWNIETQFGKFENLNSTFRVSENRNPMGLFGGTCKLILRRCVAECQEVARRTTRHSSSLCIYTDFFLTVFLTQSHIHARRPQRPWSTRYIQIVWCYMANDSFLMRKALGAHIQKGANLSWPLISKCSDLVGPSKTKWEQKPLKNDDSR